MKSTLWLLGLAVLIFGASLRPEVAGAQARSPNSRGSAQFQRALRDVVRIGSPNFFEQGQKQLEAEVKRLTQKQPIATPDLLKIDPNVTMPDSQPSEKVDLPTQEKP